MKEAKDEEEQLQVDLLSSIVLDRSRNSKSVPLISFFSGLHLLNFDVSYLRLFFF